MFKFDHANYHGHKYRFGDFGLNQGIMFNYKIYSM